MGEFNSVPNGSVKFEIIANPNNWRKVYEFLREFIYPIYEDKTEVLKILMSCEEIFVNISRYAYPSSEGMVKINVSCLEDSSELEITFEDFGIPFDPTLWETVSTNLPLSERKIGGLGVFMVKNIMDKMEYEYADGKNKLVMTKKINNLGGYQNGDF